jgi:hypothetical protein
MSANRTSIYKMIGLPRYQLAAYPIAITITKKNAIKSHVLRIFAPCCV